MMIVSAASGTQYANVLGLVLITIVDPFDEIGEHLIFCRDDDDAVMADIGWCVVGQGLVGLSDPPMSLGLWLNGVKIAQNDMGINTES